MIIIELLFGMGLLFYFFPRLFLRTYNTLIFLFSPQKPFFPLSVFPHHKLLEDNFEKIKQEMLAVYNRLPIPTFHEVDPLQKFISDEKWKVFILKWYQKEITGNGQLCPITSQLIKQIPELHLAMFSILEPHKHIPVHKGPSKACLRYHLALVIPPNKASYIEVDNQKYFWTEGEGVVFDDTYKHQVYNNSDQIRVVLFCDIERPLPFPLNKFNHFLTSKLAGFSSYVDGINKKVETVKSNK